MTDRPVPLTVPERDRLHHLIRRAARHLGAEERGALLRLWERQQAACQEPCTVAWPPPFGPHSPANGPCIVVGPHEEHRDAAGCRWRPINPIEREEQHMTDAYALQVRQQLAEARAEVERLRAHILDIDAHATPYGDLPDEPGYTGTYLLTAGALHRALGTIGHSAASCQAEAELAALHAGEEPFENELVIPTPGQWIWRWNRGMPEQRLVWAEHVVAAISDAHTCKVLAFHEQRIAEYSADRQEDLARALAAEAERDGAYRERAQLLAWLAAQHPAVLAPAPDVDEPGWQILYLNAGGEQLSWHIHPRDADLYGHVEQVTADDPRAQWDGHTTAEKYQRIATLAQRPGCPDPVECGHEAALGQAEARIAAVRGLADDLATWQAAEGVTAASVRSALIAALDGPSTPGEAA